MGVSVLKEFPRSRPVGNYSSHPSIDVEILPIDSDRHCEKCGKVVYYDKSQGIFGDWVHLDGSEGHYAQARSQCVYCHSDEHMIFSLEAWYDRSECQRCGGVQGYAIGD